MDNLNFPTEVHVNTEAHSPPTSSVFRRESVGSVAPSPDGRADLEAADLFCILQNNPHDSMAALKLASILSESGKDQEALKILRGVVKIDSRFETVLALGMAEYKLGLEDEAFARLQEAILIAPEEAPQLFDLFKTVGNIFVKRRDFDSAEDSYNKAFRLRPNSDVLLVNLGTLCIQRGQWDEALTRFRSALGICNSNDKAWVGLAIGHRMRADFDLAWGNLEAALEFNPLNEVALTLVLDWSVADGRESRAFELVRNFLVQGGWSERFSLAFSYLAWRRGDRRIASLELERLLTVNPAHAQAQELAEHMRASD